MLIVGLAYTRNKVRRCTDYYVVNVNRQISDNMSYIKPWPKRSPPFQNPSPEKTGTHACAPKKVEPLQLSIAVPGGTTTFCQDRWSTQDSSVACNCTRVRVLTDGEAPKQLRRGRRGLGARQRTGTTIHYGGAALLDISLRHQRMNGGMSYNTERCFCCGVGTGLIGEGGLLCTIHVENVGGLPPAMSMTHDDGGALGEESSTIPFRFGVQRERQGH